MNRRKTELLQRLHVQSIYCSISRNHFYFSLGTVLPLMIDDKVWDRFSFVKMDDPGPGRMRRPVTCGMGTEGYLLQNITITCNDTLLFISPEDPNIHLLKRFIFICVLLYLMERVQYKSWKYFLPAKKLMLFISPEDQNIHFLKKFILI